MQVQKSCACLQCPGQVSTVLAQLPRVLQTGLVRHSSQAHGQVVQLLMGLTPGSWTLLCTVNCRDACVSSTMDLLVEGTQAQGSMWQRLWASPRRAGQGVAQKAHRLVGQILVLLAASDHQQVSAAGGLAPQLRHSSRPAAWHM